MPTTQDSPRLLRRSPRETVRVDGPLKSERRAQYTSAFHFPGLLYAVPGGATIANGSSLSSNTAAAGKMPGVIRDSSWRQHWKDFFRSTVQPNFRRDL